MEPLILWLIRHLKLGKAMDFMAKSVAKIIEARKMNDGQDAQVSWVPIALHLGTYCVHLAL